MSVILMYHSVSDTLLDPGIQVRPETFRRHLDWLDAENYAFCSLAEALAAPGARKVAFTFDDGFTDNLSAFALLKERGIPVTLYVCPDHIGKTAAWASVASIRGLSLMDVRQLGQLASEGVEIGNHSWSHTSFRKLSPPALRENLVQSRAWFQEQLGFQPESLAFPYGHCPGELSEVVASFYETALAVEPLPDMPFHLAVPRMPALEELSREGFRLHLERYDLEHFQHV